MWFNVPADFPVIVADRLKQAGAGPGERRDAMAVLCLLLGSLVTQSFASREPARDLASRLDMDPASFTAAARLLTRVGAITVIQHRHQRRIAVTPPGAPRFTRPREYPSPYSET